MSTLGKTPRSCSGDTIAKEEKKSGEYLFVEEIEKKMEIMELTKRRRGRRVVGLLSQNKIKQTNKTKKNHSAGTDTKRVEEQMKEISKEDKHVRYEYNDKPKPKEQEKRLNTNEAVSYEPKLTWTEFNNEILRIQECLHTTDVELKGRDEEIRYIINFFSFFFLLLPLLLLSRVLKSEGGDSLYICGSPGTGKSATICSIQNELTEKKFKNKKKK
ncbi:hypothetical protein RFI_08564 [Reticulomyxa filosa]|uniref:Origin recognition complex subunit 1 n=1 Tax=Reticulomyxa filosa TaxID=46433 RepID=X6NTD4_RETFI|nr:hypothetical protein RFI_08564 [Reticulomyxa filosa]|eukprot:ETO28567.1 hypothetical protein RFI_08564 [Reticulomyxa filosa]